MKQRLEEAENFYGSIRRVRHEMKNHMTNIKGLVASEKYDEVENYIENWMKPYRLWTINSIQEMRSQM